MAKREFAPKAKKEFDQKLVDLARVTRVMAGGKRMRFRACLVVGNKRGLVGFAVAKGADVTIAVDKAARKAQKNLLSVPIVNETIPHEVRIKYKAARILIKPAPEGSGVISGGAVRDVLELAGIKNVVSKILGTNNKIVNVMATMAALSLLRPVKKSVTTKSLPVKNNPQTPEPKAKNS